MILLSLFLVFTHLSVLAFGGGNAILPEIQNQVVHIQHWMNAEQFNAMFAIAQAAPGPNMMIVPLIGWHVAGPMGLLVTSIAKFIPSSIMTALALQYWERFKHHPWRLKFQIALQPITVSLVLLGAWMMAQTYAQNILLLSIVVISIVLSLFKNLHPFYLMLIGAGLGTLLL